MERGRNGGGDEGRKQKKSLPLVAITLAQAAAAVGNPDGVDGSGGEGGEGVHGGAFSGDAGGAGKRGDDVQVAALPWIPTKLQATMASPRREEWCIAANSAMAWGEMIGVSGRNS